MVTSAELPLLPFPTVASFETWLSKHHKDTSGIWIQFFKKGTGIPTISYAEALEVALCYGWIDSQLKSIDDKSYKQKFTPRGPKSIWSKINVEHIERLMKEDKMKPSGLKAVDAAKADGRWENAYDSFTTMTIPEAFLKLLEKNKKAKESFDSLTKTNRYTIAFQLHNAKKSETRERRMHKFLAMLEKGEKNI